MKVRYIEQAKGFKNEGLTLGRVYECEFNNGTYDLINDKEDGSITSCFPFEVEVIEEEAFKGCKPLESINKKDKIVENVIEAFSQRSEVGISKYNTTLERNDLTRLEWLTHLQEELMDATLYIERLKQEYDRD